MRIPLILSLVLGLAVPGAAQVENPESAPRKIHFLRAGAEYGTLRRERYSTAVADPSPRISLLYPSYVGLWGVRYLNLALPGYFYNRKDTLREVGIGITLSYGYAPGDVGHRIRPFIVVEGSASVSWINSNLDLALDRNYVLTTLMLYPRVGLLGKIAGPIWAEVSMPAPFGFTLLEARMYSDVSREARVFSKSIERRVPAVQVALAYRF